MTDTLAPTPTPRPEAEADPLVEIAPGVWLRRRYLTDPEAAIAAARRARPLADPEAWTLIHNA